MADSPGGDSLTIVHFNDVYNIEPASREPVGGAARFLTKVQEIKARTGDALVLFSGDALNPSMISVATQGKHMVPVLEKIGVACSVIGNHDADHGTEVLADVVQMSKFPWLCSNVRDAHTGEPWCGAKASHVIEFGGKRIGLVGLVEQEWMATLGTVDPSDIVYEDFVDVGNKVGEQLREEGCDLVIALSHSRVPNDDRLASECAGIDLVLGGHDHHYEVWSKTNSASGREVTVIKSGTDFKQLTEVTVSFDGEGAHSVSTARHEITADLVPDAEMEEIVKEHFGALEEKMKQVIGTLSTALDGRFSKIRTEETTTGNFVCDILRRETGADIALLGGGMMRSDEIQGPGEFTLGDLVKILPMQSSCVVLDAPGSVVLAALNNGVSAYPKLEGRFAQVSGVSFEFDPALPEAARVVPGSVRVGGEPLDLERRYKFATAAYTASGKDGYDCLAGDDVKVLVDEENGPTLPTITRNYFRVVETLNRMSVATSNGDPGSVAKAASRKLLDRLRNKTRGDGGGPAEASAPDADAGLLIAPKVEGRVVRRESTPSHPGASAGETTDAAAPSEPLSGVKARKAAADAALEDVRARLAEARELRSGLTDDADASARRHAEARVNALEAMQERAARQDRRWGLEEAVAEAAVATLEASRSGNGEALTSAAALEISRGKTLAAFFGEEIGTAKASFARARAATGAQDGLHGSLEHRVAQAWLEAESANLLRQAAHRAVVLAHGRLTAARFLDEAGEDDARTALRGQKLRRKALAALHEAAILMLGSDKRGGGDATGAPLRARADELAREAAALGVPCPRAADVLGQALTEIEGGGSAEAGGGDADAEAEGGPEPEADGETSLIDAGRAASGAEAEPAAERADKTVAAAGAVSPGAAVDEAVATSGAAAEDDADRPAPASATLEPELEASQSIEPATNAQTGSSQVAKAAPTPTDSQAKLAPESAPSAPAAQKSEPEAKVADASRAGCTVCAVM